MKELVNLALSKCIMVMFVRSPLGWRQNHLHILFGWDNSTDPGKKPRAVSRWTCTFILGSVLGLFGW